MRRAPMLSIILWLPELIAATTFRGNKPSSCEAASGVIYTVMDLPAR
jgi:hypothetical protein